MEATHVAPSSLAISALLNNPNAALQSLRPSARDIPPVHLSKIPHISLEDFNDYISNVCVEHETYSQQKQHGLEQFVQLSAEAPSDSLIGSSPEPLENRLLDQVSSPPSVVNSSCLSLYDASSMASGLFSQKTDDEGCPYGLGPKIKAYVPVVYFEDDFDLKNPRIFDLIDISPNLSERAADPRSQRKADTTFLHDKLSTYMDSVELRLIAEVNTTSEVFFNSLTDLQSLCNQADTFVGKINDLRAELSFLALSQASRRLKRAAKLHRESNLETLKCHLVEIELLFARYSSLQEQLINKERYGAIALHLIELEKATRSIYQESERDCLSLLQELRAGIKETKSVLGAHFTSLFRDSLMTDLRVFLHAADLQATKNRLTDKFLSQRRKSSEAEAKEVMQGTLRSDIENIVQNLIYTEKVDSAFRDYQDSVIREIKIITKRPLPSTEEQLSQDRSSLESGNLDKSAVLARALRAMKPAEFLMMIDCICMMTCEFVRRLAKHEKLLLDLFTTAKSLAPGLATQTRDMILKVVEISQSRMVKVLNVRASINSTLSAREFSGFYKLVYLCNAECETLSGRLGIALQDTLNTQARLFITNFTNQNLELQASEIEKDLWQPSLVSNMVQSCVNMLLDGATRDVDNWDLPAIDSRNQDVVLCKHLAIEGQKFFLPSSCLSLIASLKDHLSLLMSLPAFASDIISSVVSLLGLYNSKSSQLILGAGAMRSVGLERITAKNLAIASQALTAISIMIPCMSEYLRRNGYSSLYSTDFANIQHATYIKAYQQHQEELHTKLVAIMMNRMDVLCKSIDISGSAGSAASQVPSEYMTLLIKDTIVLYKVLAKFLQEETVLSIMNRVVDLEERKLLDVYSKPASESAETRNIIKVDIDYFVQKLSSLHGVCNVGSALVKNFVI